MIHFFLFNLYSKKNKIEYLTLLKDFRTLFVVSKTDYVDKMYLCTYLFKELTLSLKGIPSKYKV